jgi:pilus assembly protein CpaB
MRKQRGLVFIFVGVILAAIAGLFVYQTAQRIASQPAQVVVQKESIPRVYVVVTTRDIGEDEKIAAGDVATKEFPVDFVPEGAVAGTDLAVGKYALSTILRGQIVVASFLTDKPKPAPQELAARIPSGKIAMSVMVQDALNQIGVLKAGDHVDILLTIDLKEGLAKEQQSQQQGAPKEERLEKYISTQLTMQDVEILLIGVPEVTPTPVPAATATPIPPTPAPGVKFEPTRVPAPQSGRTVEPTPVPEVAQRTITFLLNPQEAVTLKYIKDSGGTMDLVLRSRGDRRLVKTDPMSIDTLYQQFRFRFPEPIKQAGGQ